jgi:uncharacterized protein YndB with AHSA1/START domain
MSVTVDDSGNRSVQAEVEVPGTPDEVWKAIATGPGITSWFVPSEVEEREGGVTTSNFGPGMESRAKITHWDPPHRFVAESLDDMGPDYPPTATEWIVEARDGGTCTVRVVHRWFASTDDWDEQFVGHTYGWLSFFRVLHAYLAHFSGQAATPIQFIAIAPEPKEDAWASFTGPLGLAGATVGQRVTTENPPLDGKVEWAGQPAWPEELLIHLDQPAPGIAHFVPHPMGGQVYLALRFYLFGADQSAVDLATQQWQSWVNEHFPA